MRLIREAIERFGAVAYERNLKSFTGEVFGQHLSELAVIVHDQE
jgi:hypothetical protein